MKKLVQVLAVGVLMFGYTATAAAEDFCSITVTGPNSINTCSVNNETVVSIACDNGVTITNDTDQTATSGVVIVHGNANGGNAGSGAAANVNQTVTFAAANCGPAVAAANPVTPAQVTPSGGQGAAAPAPAPAPAKVKALPKTGESDVLATAGMGALVLIAAAGSTQLALAAYRRSSN